MMRLILALVALAFLIYTAATAVTQVRPDERAVVREALNSDRFVDCAPREVYATLLDEGVYHCSWRSMYRILADHAEVRERRD